MKTLLRLSAVLCVAILANFTSTANGQLITSGLRLQLDATQITGLSNGDLLPNWFDVSGNDNNFQQGNSADQPTYFSSGINGLAAVQFGGGLSALDTKLMTLVTSGSSTGLNITGTALTVFVVLDFYTLTPGFEQNILGNYNGAGTGYSLYKNRNTLDFVFYAGGGVVDGALVVDEPTIFGGVKSPTAETIYQDGTEEGSAASTNPTLSSAGAFTLGWSSFNDGPLRAYVGEVLIYDRTLDSGEITQVNNYLDAKWINPVPEPSTAMLAGLGGIAAFLFGGRRRK